MMKFVASLDHPVDVAAILFEPHKVVNEPLYGVEMVCHVMGLRLLEHSREEHQHGS